jgi:hypothetical protein
LFVRWFKIDKVGALKGDVYSEKLKRVPVKMS